MVLAPLVTAPLAQWHFRATETEKKKKNRIVNLNINLSSVLKTQQHWGTRLTLDICSFFTCAFNCSMDNGAQGSKSEMCVLPYL